MKASPSIILLLLGSTATAHCTYEHQTDRDPGLTAAAGEPTFELAATVPQGGQHGVSIGTAVELRLSAAPDPDTVVATNVRVFAGLVETPGQLTVDLLDRWIRFAPLSPLRPNLRHQVYVHRSLRGLNGAGLGETVIFNFTTGDSDTTQPETAPPGAAGARVQADLFAKRCATCHRQPDPPARVDLSSVQSSVASLRAQPASFGGKLRVAPHKHAQSYLMLKLLGEGGFVGFRMPATGSKLSRVQLRMVASWIDAGALP